ncbi:MAG: putative toxin-antitoxin system toxin component, PIN family [Proteobacteria bacterium]|nr:putative toxin-antitoxin system toxin component, PIN family [Pseudomonadota bacterium]
MGEKKKKIKVIFDTNILISALILKGKLSRIVKLWKAGIVIPVFSRETFKEFKDVLEYPKFSLSKSEIKTIIEEEVLPFFEVVDVTGKVQGVCRDPDDDKFISCAVSASADLIVSGDKDLCDLGIYKSVKIIRASDFIKMFNNYWLMA